MVTGKPSIAGAGVRGSVLIFLKSESFAESLKKGLETSGYRSTAVTTESLALTQAKANVPSVIVLDRRSDSIANFRRMSMPLLPGAGTTLKAAYTNWVGGGMMARQRQPSPKDRKRVFSLCPHGNHAL